MDLESAADELYGSPPEKFIERRKQLAVEARAAGNRQLAKSIGLLRRPTRSGWLVNLLALNAAADLEAFFELGAALGEAQQRASGPDLRRLSKERHTALEALSRRAVELAAEHEYTATDAVRQEVSQTLQAALAESGLAELVRLGRVTQPEMYGGFGPLDLGGLVPEPQTQPESEPAQPHGGQDEQAEEAPARLKAKAAVAAANEALVAARAEAVEAERAAEEATARADELADQVEALRTQLDEAAESERRSRDAAREARKHHQQVQQSVTAGEQALAEAERSLAKLDRAAGGP